MDYYHIRTYTPFVGEEMDAYIAAETITEYHKKADQCAGENGMMKRIGLSIGGYDKDEDDYDAVCNEYYAQCGWHFLGMITKEEYEKLEREGEWCV